MGTPDPAQNGAAASFDMLPGVSANLAVKAAIAERLVLIKYYVKECSDPDLLKWIRNQLSEPYVIIQRRLDSLGELEKPQKEVATRP